MTTGRNPAEWGPLSQFGSMLRDLRRRALLSQERLAQLSGLGTRTVRDLERGRTERPHGDTVRLLADALELRGDVRARFESCAAGEEPPPAPCQLPPDVADFTGRDEQVADLHAFLAAELPAGIAVAVVSGKAGVGKTALAVHVAHRLATRFPDGRLFVNLGGAGRAVDAGEALTRALQALGVHAAAVPEQADERAALYRARLADRRVLVLVDNAGDEAHVRPLLPGAGRSAALVTSRSVLAGLEACHRVSLQELEPERSVELLARVAGDDRLDPDEARTIVELCGRLPLAVRIAGARLATKSHLRPGWLVERLADEHRRLDELRAGDLAVRTSFNAGYQALDPEVRGMFGVLGLLDAADFPAWVPATLVGSPPDAAEDMLERLVDANLLDVAGRDAAGRPRYRMHDLLAVFARERLHEERAVTRHQVGLGMVLDAWLGIVDWVQPRLPEGMLAAGQPALAGAALGSGHGPDALAPGWLTPDRVAMVTPAVEDDSAGLGDAGWAVACALVAFSFELRAHWDDGPATRQGAALAARRTGDRLEPADETGRLVVTPGEPGEWGRLADRLETCATVFRELGERRWHAATLLALGNVIRADGRLDDAAATLERARSAFREVGARGWEAAALFSLGSLHAGRGRIDEAEAAYLACLEGFRERGDRTWAAYTLRGLGYAYQQVGRFDEAVGCLARCLPVFREIGDRLWEAHTELTLAYAERGRSRCAASAAHARAAELILRELGDRRGEAMALRARGAAALDLGHLEQALACCRGGLAVFRALGDPAGAALATLGLGRVYRELGRHDEAADAFHACVPVFRDMGLRRWEVEALRALG